MEPSNHQRIYRSNDRIIAGVIGGFAERFDLEPTILRLTVVFLTVLTGIVPGVITYLVAMFIMPAGASSEAGESAPTTATRSEPRSSNDRTAEPSPDILL